MAKLDSFLIVINKFIGAILVMILGTMMTMSSTIGAIDERSKTTKEIANDTRHEMVAVKVQVNFLIENFNPKPMKPENNVLSRMSE